MKIEKDPRLWKETNVGLGPAPLVSRVILGPRPSRGSCLIKLLRKKVYVQSLAYSRHSINGA